MRRFFVFTALVIFLLVGYILYYSFRAFPSSPQVTYTVEATASGIPAVRISQSAKLERELQAIGEQKYLFDQQNIKQVTIELFPFEQKDIIPFRVENTTLFVPVFLVTAKLNGSKQTQERYISEQILLFYYSHLMDFAEFGYGKGIIMIPAPDRLRLLALYQKELDQNKVSFVKLK